MLPGYPYTRFLTQTVTEKLFTDTWTANLIDINNNKSKIQQIQICEQIQKY